MLWTNMLWSQSAKDVTVPMSAIVNPSPLAVVVQFENPVASNILILRRTKGQTGAQWVQAFSQTNSTVTGVIDNSVVAGQTYEYVIQRTANNLNAYGYVHVAVGAPAVDNRGKILIIVDSTTAEALGTELVRMKNDMRGDGWVATPVKIGPSATVASVKSLIVQQYNADPANLKAVFLIGRVPIPYSGGQAWDGHSDHVGAWPCDNYYADIDGVWTDNTVNIPTAGRTATVNVPGDGKFDQNYTPSPTELQIGRLDFRRLTQGTFGATEIELLSRYLNKNHDFRTKKYTVDYKALVDDNFGYFSGEAFASAGYRNAYPVVGSSNIVEADFFNDTDNQSYILGYGCGGGWYQGASGVGASTNFGTDSINVVFSNLFGSYFGDWDYETDPFMPSALASKGGILTCGWAGRPTFFLHSMASGETIGYAMKETQNAPTNNGFYGTFGEGGAHIALLGDPTLRAYVVEPPSNVTAAQNCNNVVLNWTAPADTNVIGYYVYRSTSLEGPYTRITSNWLTTNSYSETVPAADTFYYQVRALEIMYTPGGGIWLNNSVGQIKSIVLTLASPPTLTANAPVITCNESNVAITLASNQQITCAWTGPNSFTSTQQNPVVSNPGAYTVTVTAPNGCTATTTVNVTKNVIPPSLPNLTVSNNGVLTCSANTVNIATNATGASLLWTGPNGFTSTNSSITVSNPGTYTVIATSTANGCTSSASAVVIKNVQTPNVSIETPSVLTCTTLSAKLNLTSNAPASFQWSGPGGFTSNLEDPQASIPGTYSVTVTASANGCSSTSSIAVAQDVAVPDAAISGNPSLSCSNPSSQLTGNTNTPNANFAWSGPGGYNANTKSITVTVSGTYILVVTGQNGCTGSSSIIVLADGSVPDISATASGNVTCSNPYVTLQGNSNTSGVSYTWKGPNGFMVTQQNPVVTAGGQYTLVVTATNGCSAVSIVNVLEDLAIPALNLATPGTLNCNLPCISLVSNIPGITLEPAQICSPGQYTVVATGENGCTNSASVVITKAPPLLTQLQLDPITCTGPSAATVVVGGGTPPFAYLWSTGETTQTIQIPNNLPLNLSVTVSDAGGCSVSTSPVVVTQPPPIVVSSPIVKNCSAFNSNDGAIELVVSGGNGTYLYLWNNGNTTPNNLNLAAGIYTCTITDAVSGCTATVTAVVAQPVATTNIVGVLGIQLLPNPTSSRYTQLHIQMENEQEIQVKLLDETGRLIWTSNPARAREFKQDIDLNNCPAGVYTVQAIVSRQIISRKLVVLTQN